ncbi:patatin-like phospholipase family protein [Rurimicrobium arvi]|uniref:Patatin-like phospholipase family protein n=1 Tax=Rurimicrobium arvi TaxID=2049916 RepID=A0ABP8MJB9_9BACT
MKEKDLTFRGDDIHIMQVYQKTGLVLSGGGFRGFAHLGVLKALDELQVPVHIIAGTSAGALMAAAYAAGNKPEAICAQAKEFFRFGLGDLLRMRHSFYPGKLLLRLLQVLVPEDNFSKLHIPLIVVATDIRTSKSVTFSSGALWACLIGAASVPGIFEPVSVGSHLLVDGGVLNNLPASMLPGNCDRIIGVHVNKADHSEPLKWSRMKVIEQCFHLAVADTVYREAQSCTVFIEPALTGIGMFDWKKIDRAFEAGYEETMRHKALLLS